MNRTDIERIVMEVVAEKIRGQDSHDCTRDGTCGDKLCVVHNKQGVRTIIGNGASRVSAGPGVEAAGGVDRDLAGMIDHTLLKPEATTTEIDTLCAEARKFGFASVCVNPTHVARAAQLLKGSTVKVCTVIGFPLGASSTPAKGFETEQACRDGAQEIDMVINIGLLKSGAFDAVQQDIAAVVRAAKKARALTKVILETALLTDEEKVKGCLLAKQAGADFVKTSTGFSKGGATAGDVALMRKVVGHAMGVKAAGGVRTREDAISMIASGADRIGASASVKIVSGQSDQQPQGY